MDWHKSNEYYLYEFVGLKEIQDKNFNPINIKKNILKFKVVKGIFYHRKSFFVGQFSYSLGVV